MSTLVVEFWHWLILGLVLMTLEVLVPATIFLWFGFGALVTGGILAFTPNLPLAGQILIFALISLSSVFAWRYWRREDQVVSDTPELNNRLYSHIGKQYKLTEAIQNGRGAIRVGDTAWRVSGPDLPAGTTVQVIGVDGVIFTVKPVI